MNSPNHRLDALRGGVAPVDHNARTIAALAGNPGCDRRAVLDAAGIHKQSIAVHLGHPAPFGQSPFALDRARAFEELVKADGCAHLVRLLRETLGLSVPEVAYTDIADVGGNTAHQLRHTRTLAELRRAAEDGERSGTLFDHPLLKLPVAGHEVYLEPSVIAFQIRGRFHIVEIKSFAVIDGTADSGQVAAASRLSAVYVYALKALFRAEGIDPDRVSHEVVLVCPKDFANHPTATLLDVRQQLASLNRQLSRLTRIDRILDHLPPELTFSLEQSPAELARAIRTVEARYAPECLSACEMAYFCRADARVCGSVDVLGRATRDELGGLESIDAVLDLTAGDRLTSPEQAEIADQLRYVRAVYREHASAGAEAVA
ncbi:hypothetical protein [Microtetraspora sp. NBRC 16547]|uniref:hypothetical protein n=1 Tax=Microtetraspora sp. NBRC 16547 TaxID=3030993 RepID=UPI0024A333E4|nr:hypothetical protein [Microtetraspora sp. NBRC 16547]GLX00579.1 hypothetical protein Misp02_46650 [Microtetraspora sp. NBRC 16547]